MVSARALGDTLYWDGTNNALWTDVTAWSTSSSATTPNPASPPGSADDVWFNISTVNGAITAYLNGTQAANSLTFRNTNTTSLLSGAAANSGVQTLSLGGGGVTVNSGAGATTVGSSANPISFALTTSQTWANNSTSTLAAYGSYVGSAASGTQAFTIGGSGNTTISGSIGDGGGGGALGLVKTGAGTLTLRTGTIGSGTSGFSGGVWIQSGRLQLATAATSIHPAITTFDPLLGAVPASPTPANIRIGDGATLGLDTTPQNSSISANRGIQIDGVGRIEFTGDQRSSRTFTYAGVIAGTSANDRLVVSTAPAGALYAQDTFNAMTATFSGNNSVSGGLLVTTSVIANPSPQTSRWAVVLSGSNNFGTGVVIDGADATPILRSAAAGALGQNISANGVTLNFGELSLASAASLGSNQTVTVNGFSGVLNTVDLGYSGAVPTNIHWKSAYGGVVGVGVGTFSQQLDMSTLGSAADGNEGRLFLGVGQFGNGQTQKTSTYSAATLGVGADATYRLGGGGNTARPGVLIFSNAVLTGENSVLIGRNAAFNGAADVRLNASNAYSGATTIDQGVLTLTTAAGAIPNTSAITVNSGGTLVLNNTSTANNTNRVGDSTPITLNGGGITFANNAGAANYSESLGALTLGKGNALLTGSQAASGQSSTLTFASFARNAGATLQVNGTSVGADARNRIVFTDPAGIKDNAGNAIPGGSVIPWAMNGFSGSVTGFMTHSSGTLQAYAFTAAETKTGTSGWTNDASEPFASTANVRWLPGLTGASATLTVPTGTTTINSLSYYGTGATVPSPANLTINGATDRLVIASGAVYITSENAGRGLTINGSGALTAAAGATELVFFPNGTSTVSARIIDPDENTRMGVTVGPGGGGRLILSGSHSYSGDTVISNGGQLRVTAANALPFGSGKGDLYVYGTLGVNNEASNAAITINGLWGNGSVIAITNGLTVGAANASSEFDGIFAESALAGTPLTKIGTGTLTLTGFSPLMTGSFTVRDGVLAVASVRDGGYASALGAFSTAASSLILSDSTTNGTLRYVGQDPNSTNRLFTVGGNTAGVMATIDASGSTPTASSGVNSRATLSFTGTGAIAWGTADQTRTLRFAGSNTGTNAFAPQINDNGSGVVSVIKDGGGRWLLSGSNSFTGGLSLNAGSLEVGHAAALGTGGAAVSGGRLELAGFSIANAVTLSGSGILAGIGSVGDLVVNSGGVLAPGNSPGTITAANVTWNGNGSYRWEMNNALGTAGLDPGWDLLSATGSLTIGATAENPFTIQLTSLTAANEAGQAAGWNPDTDGQWLIAQFGSPIAGFSADVFVLDDSAFVGMGGGRSFSLALGSSVEGGTASQLYVVYAVPEPATVILAGMGIAAMAWVARRRRMSRARGLRQ
jgi:fibronectin-binding autotransporter adhesin